MRSDGHTNTWATEAEILATSEAYKCDIFVLSEQYKIIGWQKFSFDKECNHNKKSIKILNTVNHFKLVTDEKRVCICVERSKGGKSVILNDGKTTRIPNSEQISEEGIVHGTLNEQIENLIGNYWENIQEKEPRHIPAQSGKNAADPAETIETIYNKIVYFKHHNMFTPSQRTTTEMMTREMKRIIEEYNNDTSGKEMAMKLLMIIPKLLLQKEHMKAKKKENDKAFRRRMEAWQKGEYLELMEKAEAFQKRVRQQPMVETEGMIARKFRKRMEEGNVHQAARLLRPQQAGLLQINKETTEKLKEKHPAGTRTTQEALLSGEIEAPHPVTFSSINQEMVRKAAMETKGAPGPSGMDANTWGMLLTSKRNSMAAADLCKVVAELAQKMDIKTANS